MVESALKSRAAALVATMSLVWVISIYGFTNLGFVYQLALVPRRIDGLMGVITMPFVHESLSHLVVNTVPLSIMAGLLLLRGVRYYCIVSIAIILASGSAVWLVGRTALHVGASGLVFGYFGFLLVRGVYDRQASSVVIALLIVFLYGGLLWGVVPSATGVSWESHVSGLLVGGLIARVAGSRRIGGSVVPGATD